MKYEVEIKSLLVTEAKAKEVLYALAALSDPKGLSIAHSKQLNHYFEKGDPKNLLLAVGPDLTEEAYGRLKAIIEATEKLSVRTRDKDGKVYFVVKGSIGDDSSANGISRMELEEELNMPLEDLDDLILSSGFWYQAKWSRERDEFMVWGINVCIDKNAGYGYLAEFEVVVDSQDEVPLARKEIEVLMSKIGVSELPQDRLERMFDFYNKNWADYYGTEKIFSVD